MNSGSRSTLISSRSGISASHLKGTSQTGTSTTKGGADGVSAGFGKLCCDSRLE